MGYVVKTLGTVAQYINGRAFKPSEWEESGRPIIRIQNLTDNKAMFHYSSKEHENKYLVQKGDLLFAWAASLGAHIWKGQEAWLNQHIFRVIPNDDVRQDYLYYYLIYVIADLYAKTHGSGMVHITKGPFMNTPIPVPPLEEQTLIVARIEELFSELDAGVDTLQKIKQQLSVYRQAVLKEAFAGELTETWRQIHPEETTDSIVNLIEARGQKIDLELLESIPIPAIPNAWKWVNLGSVSSGPEYGTSQKSSDTGKIPVIRMGNLQKGRIDWRDLAYTSNDEDIEKYRLSKGDVLFNRTNSPDLVGKTAIYRGEREAIFAGYLIRINQLDCIDPDYLTYYMNSSVARSYGNSVKTDGVNQSNINGKKLCSYPFPLCSEAEQKQVVYGLESRLSLCDGIEKTVDEALQQSTAMRHSILKQAFEGEL